MAKSFASPESDRIAAARRAALSLLLPIPPRAASDLSIDGRRRLVRLLGRALRAERQRGLSGHWTYDLARHAALAALTKAEREALAALANKTGANPAAAPVISSSPVTEA